MKICKDTRSENKKNPTETLTLRENRDLFCEELQENPDYTHIRAYDKQCTICTLDGVQN